MIGRDGSTDASRSIWLAVGLVLISLAVYWLGNDRISLVDRDEPRYAGTARNMLATGDYIVPYFNGKFRYQKPVLTYWLVALSQWTFGDTIFAARFFSGLCVAGSLALVIRLGNEMFGRPVGLLAAVVLSVSPTVVLMGKLCVPDGPQFLFSTWAFASLYRLIQTGWRERQGGRVSAARRARTQAAAFQFWIATGLAILTKGPIVPGMVLVTLLAQWFWTGLAPWKLRLRWGMGLVVLSAVVGPWLVAILATAGTAFFHESIGRQLIERAVRPFDEKFLPPGYYLGSLAVGMTPWVGLLLLAAARLAPRARSDWRVGFLFAWAIGPMLLLELFRTKQPHYYLPSYPALAIEVALLAVPTIRAGFRWNVDWWARAGLAMQASVALAAVAGGGWLAIVIGGAPGRLALVAAAGLGVASWLAMIQLARGRVARGLAAQWAGAVLAWAVAGGAVAPQIDDRRVVKDLALEFRERQAQHRIVPLALGPIEPSIVYYAGEAIDDPQEFQEFSRELRWNDQPVRLIVTDAALRIATMTIPDKRYQIERSWRGWVKMHTDTIHLVLVTPEAPDIANADGSDPR